MQDNNLKTRSETSKKLKNGFLRIVEKNLES